MSNEHVHPLFQALLTSLDKKTAGEPPKPPYPFCCHAEKCIASGRCERRVGGELHCCAD